MCQLLPPTPILAPPTEPSCEVGPCPRGPRPEGLVEHPQASDRARGQSLSPARKAGMEVLLLLLLNPGSDHTLLWEQNGGDAEGLTKFLGSTCLLPAWQRKGDRE